jgi:hypothetical protein
MNERIWKLAEQIVCFEQDMDGSMEPNEDGQWIRVDELEKFAQSIVQECAKIAEKEQAYNNGHEIHVNINQCILIEFGL